MLSLLVLASLAAAPPPPSASAFRWTERGVDVDVILDSLSVEQKVGQLMLVGFGGTQMDGTIATFLDEVRPGGVALFSRNIDSRAQTARLIGAVRAHDPVARTRTGDTAVPLFVAVDQEGGNVVRLKNDALVLPSAMALGAANDVGLARAAGTVLGEDLRAWGFNMNLAPVLDVNSNPRNPVIGIRSFGADPATVAELGVAYIRGLESAGVLAVAKHFPGHGDTDADSHYHLPVLPHDHDRLLAVELFPFARAFAEGLPAVMTAHIALPAVAEGDIPATVSSRVLTDLLRTELGYDGLVITDGLEMQGIVEKYGSGEAAVRAVVAGADMVMVLWFPEKKREVREKLLDAVRSGRIPRARLDQAVRRVLTAKARHGLFETFSPPSVDDERAREQRRSAVTREIAERAVTIVKNDRGVLPLHQGTTVLAAATEPLFLSELQKTLQVQAFTLSQAPTTARLERDAAQLIAQARRADVIVIGMMNSDHAVLVHRVRRAHPNKKLVVVSFGTPYLLSHVGDVDAYVCAFGWREESERAAGQVLVGKKPPRGRMPVTLPGVMTAGSQTLLMSSPTPARPVVAR